VLNNGDLSEVSWEMREMEGNPRFPSSQDLPSFPYAQYAEILGFEGMRVDGPDIVGKTLDLALQADHPVLIEAMVDRDTPLLAPHLDAKHSKMMRQGLQAEGDAGVHAHELLMKYNNGQMEQRE